MEVDVSKVVLSSHAQMRSKERFKMNPKEALPYFRSQLERAKYVGVIEDSETNKPSHLFAKDRIAIFLSLDCKTILTIYKCESVTYDPLKNKVLELHRKRYNRYCITEKARTKRLEQLKLESDIEVAECKLRIHKTKSEVVMKVCEARIAAIKQSLTEYQQEIEQLKSEKRRIMKSMISVM